MILTFLISLTLNHSIASTTLFIYINPIKPIDYQPSREMLQLLEKVSWNLVIWEVSAFLDRIKYRGVDIHSIILIKHSISAKHIDFIKVANYLILLFVSSLLFEAGLKNQSVSFNEFTMEKRRGFVAKSFYHLLSTRNNRILNFSSGFGKPSID